MERIIAALLLLAASPAFACGVLEKADPKVGATVDAPERLTLIFSQSFVPASSGFTLTDSHGKEVKAGKTESGKGDTALSAKLPPLAPGSYKVTWSLLWRDCNSKTRGDYKFTVK